MVFERLISRVICIAPVLTLTIYGTILLITDKNSYVFAYPNIHPGWILMLAGLDISASIAVLCFLVYYIVLFLETLETIKNNTTKKARVFYPAFLLLFFFQHLEKFLVAHYAGQIVFHSFFVQILA